MKKNVLLVEDDLKFRSSAVSVLEKQSCDVIQAVTAQEARTELAAGHFDLMIVDGSLPDACGLEIIKEIRHSGRPIPIMYISAYAHDTEYFYQLTADLNVDLVLHKPISPTNLGDQIRIILNDESVPEAEHPQDDILATLTKEYGESLPSLVSPMIVTAKKYIEAEDTAAFESTMHCVHKIKGTAGSYGFDMLSEILAEVETYMQELHDNYHLRWQPGCVQKLNDLLMQVVHLSVNASVHVPCSGSSSAGSTINGRNRKVMLFDDDHAFCRRVEALLTAENFLVYSFTDAVKFKETLNQIRPDLLLLDINLGIADGLKLCCEVRSNALWKDLGIVFLTGSQEPGLRSKALSLGANHFMTKPINNAELLRVASSCSGSVQIQVPRHDGIRVYSKEGETLRHEVSSQAG